MKNMFKLISLSLAIGLSAGNINAAAAGTTAFDNINACNDEGLTPLMRAIMQEEIDAIHKLFENQLLNASLSTEGLTPLMYAIIQGKTEAVRALLAYPSKININALSSSGYSALMLAIRENNIEAIKLLVACPGVCIFTTYFDDKVTALMFALEYFRFDNRSIDAIPAVLSSKDINRIVNATNKNGLTALMLAVDYKLNDAILLLLQQEDLDVDVRDRYGNNALIRAAKHNKIDSMKKLLGDPRVTANLDATNKNGKDALTVAVEKGNDVIVTLLKKAMEKERRWSGLRKAWVRNAVTPWS